MSSTITTPNTASPPIQSPSLTELSTSKPPSIGLIICSTRQPRVCPQIATFITSCYTTWSQTHPTAPPLIPIDLYTLNLPFSTEPLIPSQITSHTQYTHPHTRSWSLLIQSHSAFIFLTPQYNHGYPAPLKNAIDYLYHEWKGKVAAVITYGGHGGGKAAGQLKQVLRAVGMRVVNDEEEEGAGTALMFPDRNVMGKACRGEDIGWEEGGWWEGEREGLERGFERLVGMMGLEVREKAEEKVTGGA